MFKLNENFLHSKLYRTCFLCRFEKKTFSSKVFYFNKPISGVLRLYVHLIQHIPLRIWSLFIFKIYNEWNTKHKKYALLTYYICVCDDDEENKTLFEMQHMVRQFKERYVDTLPQIFSTWMEYQKIFFIYHQNAGG